MRKNFKRICAALLTGILTISSSTMAFASEYDVATANEVQEAMIAEKDLPTSFSADLTVQEISDIMMSAYSVEEAWGASETRSDGTGGQYITHRTWVDGDDIDGLVLNIVLRAEKKAVEAKYGSVSKNYEYKLETTQHIVMSGIQTQGYITASATSTCYGRRAKQFEGDYMEDVIGVVLAVICLLAVFAAVGLRGKALQDFVDRVTKKKDDES